MFDKAFNHKPLTERIRAVRFYSSCSGFTLVEVMIVLVVLAILAVLALPAYQQTLQRIRRSDAVHALLDAAAREELFMLRESSYTDDMHELGFTDDPLVSDGGHYRVDATACDTGALTNCYRLTANPVADSPQASDQGCTAFSLDSFGRRSASGRDVGRCW